MLCTERGADVTPLLGLMTLARQNLAKSEKSVTFQSKANFAHRGKVDLVCVYVVLLGSLERVEHDCPRKAAAGQFMSHCDSTMGRVASC